MLHCPPHVACIYQSCDALRKYQAFPILATSFGDLVEFAGTLYEVAALCVHMGGRLLQAGYKGWRGVCASVLDDET